MRPNTRTVGWLALTLLLGAAARGAEAPPEPQKIQGGAAVETTQVRPDSPVIAGNNRFALDLYGKLRSGQGNLFFSPYSVSTALAMTAVGAKGDTADQMAQTLHLPADPSALADGFASLIASVNGAGQEGPRPYKLLTANALWLQKDKDFLPDYLKIVRSKFAAGLEKVDYKNDTEGARKTINAWVEKQTEDKIQELLQPSVLTPDTTLVLTNAIYFKGSWDSPFAESATKTDDVFRKADGTKATVAMMRKNLSLRCLETDAFQMVAIPYQGHSLEMVVLLPKKVDGLPGVEAMLTAAKLDEWSKAAASKPVDLEFPRFKLTEEFDLARVLADMGMPLAFDRRQADFSGMTGRPDQAISNVIHKAYVDVNEKGTEAAAATAVVMVRAMAVMPREPMKFRADHPFAFVIRETRMGSILFLGRLSDPK